MPTTLERPLSAIEALFGENPSGSSDRARATLKITDMLSFRIREKPVDRSILRRVHSIAQHMREALDEDGQASEPTDRRASFTLHWGGERVVSVEYAELEDESTVIGISGSMAGQDEVGKTVLVLDKHDNLGVDNYNSGEVVPEIMLPSIRKAELGPLVDAVNRGIEQGKAEITTGSPN